MCERVNERPLKSTSGHRNGAGKTLHKRSLFTVRVTSCLRRVCEFTVNPEPVGTQHGAVGGVQKEGRSLRYAGATDHG